MHHHLDMTTDEEIQDKVEPWDRHVPTLNATRKPHDKLQIWTQRSWRLNLKNKVDLKMTGIGKLAGNTKGDRRKEDRRTCRKIQRLLEYMGNLGGGQLLTV
ncbi:hypothetical protein GW17_00062183, partial [Ensete ventricosum]